MPEPSHNIEGRPVRTSWRSDVLGIAGWRRAVADLYASVRREPDPVGGHELWRRGRDELFRQHAHSPLADGDPMRERGLQYFPYDPAWRFEVPILPAATPRTLSVDTSDGRLFLELVGRVRIPDVGVDLGVWWLAQYGGGLFVPVRDATAGAGTYGGGRYLLDTAKGADLGTRDGLLVVDFNFLYHPSCRYSSDWSCPLAPAENSTGVAIRAGERL